MRVLVVVLVKREPPGQHWYGARLYGRALQTIFRLDWDEQLDYLFLVGGDQNIRGVHDKSTAYLNIARKYEQARQHALACDYDALLEIESDMIVPPDALRKLAAVDAGVVYGLYVWRHGLPQWSAYTELHGKIGVSLSKTPQLARRLWGKVVEVQGVGDGCTLIRRETLRQVQRWTDDGGFASCDWHLAEDCQALGIVQKAHLGVVCGHMSMEPSPRVLWPDPEAKRLYRVEFLTPPDYARQVGDKIEVECRGMIVADAPLVVKQ